MSILPQQRIREAKDKKLTRLDIGNCGLTEIPEEVFELTWLEELMLCDKGRYFDYMKKENKYFHTSNMLNFNQLHDFLELPNLFNLSTFTHPHWENLTKLKLLFIANYDLTVPSAGVGFLKHLINLEILAINGFNLKNFSWLENLTKLQQLDISLTGITNLNIIKNLSQLKRLFISRTNVCDLNPLTNLSQLEWLDIRETLVEDLTPLKKMIEKGIPVKLSNRSWTGNGIYCTDCPLNNPPKEIVEEGNKAILDYWSKHS